MWRAIDELGDRQSFHLLERYVAGDVYHVDACVWQRDVPFAAVHRYGQPPMDVAHQGGIFVTQTLPRASAEQADLLALNREVTMALGLVRGVTHTEFIRSRDDGRWFFLETAARVGGAHIVEVVEAATGLNLWREWADIEIAGEDGTYEVPAHADRAAGLVLSLARQREPDTSAYADPEIVFRVNKPYHVGLIVASDREERVAELLSDYAARFRDEFFATAPLPDKPTS